MLKRRNIVPRRLPTISGIALAAAVIGATPAAAQDLQSRFEMTVIRDAAYGAKIVTGNVSDAIEKIESRDFRAADRFFVNNNLCVAYTMTADFGKAKSACDAAVGIMEEANALPYEAESVINTRYQAMALTNRGVLNAMRGKADQARVDFEKAGELRAGSAAPSRNLAYLDRRSAQANVE